MVQHLNATIRRQATADKVHIKLALPRLGTSVKTVLKPLSNRNWSCVWPFCLHLGLDQTQDAAVVGFHKPKNFTDAFTIARRKKQYFTRSRPSPGAPPSTLVPRHPVLLRIVVTVVTEYMAWR